MYDEQVIGDADTFNIVDKVTLGAEASHTFTNLSGETNQVFKLDYCIKANPNNTSNKIFGAQFNSDTSGSGYQYAEDYGGASSGGNSGTYSLAQFARTMGSVESRIYGTTYIYSYLDLPDSYRAWRGQSFVRAIGTGNFIMNCGGYWVTDTTNELETIKVMVNADTMTGDIILWKKSITW